MWITPVKRIRLVVIYHTTSSTTPSPGYSVQKPINSKIDVDLTFPTKWIRNIYKLFQSPANIGVGAAALWTQAIVLLRFFPDFGADVKNCWNRDLALDCSFVCRSAAVIHS
jgi:hypothetical protein